MNNKYWQEVDVLHDELIRPDKKGQSKQKKRKWRKIEAIKEQRRLRRGIANFEQYSY
ncbi:MAG TPA: hypothetical protein DIS98_09315 [Colwellia sp.]|nr:hypothetical protein [Colwellia sp.]|tara:strand:+ start:799 stop:969 length:171 start_codon:yes stop_codon:yes gene_type:complete